MGENGAGKSTLMAVAAGSTVPDSGTVEIGGQPLESASPAAAQALGLGDRLPAPLDPRGPHRHREHGLRDAARRCGRRCRARAAWTRAAARGRSAPRSTPPTRVSDLSTADRQLRRDRQGARARRRRCWSSTSRPSRSRRPRASASSSNIRAIRDQGTAVVYISHRLPEVKRIADRITVLRDGETRGTLRRQPASPRARSCA